MARLNSILAAILTLAAAGGASAQKPVAQPVPAAGGRTATFTVFVSGAAVGSEEVSVFETADGWTIRSSGRLGVPVNLTNSRFEVRYDRDWKPQILEIDAALRGLPFVMKTDFAGGKASTVTTQGGQNSSKTDSVASDTIVLPNLFFGAYEALARRLVTSAPGTQLRAYITPQVEIAITVVNVGSERIKTASSLFDAKRYNLTFANPSGPVAAEVWVDDRGGLVRLLIPAQGVEVARDDVVSVAARVERLSRATDERVTIQASGFAIAATMSKPGDAAAGPVVRRPVVVLVPGSGPADRDEMVAGVPIYAQLANAIADAGFIVVRYDKRGIGQSGGRDESANISDFSDDVRSVLRYVEKRKDVDPKKIAIFGYGEAGFVSLQAASEEKSRLAAVVLAATPGTTGMELVLEQQRRLLDRMNLPEEERSRRMDLQQRILKAVVSGNGWESVPPSYRKQAETPWFRSFVTFDPAKLVKKLVQPLLVLHGSLDRSVPERHGHVLADLAAGRRNDPGSRLVVVDGINHLLIPALTGEPEEYSSLGNKTVSPTIVTSLVGWLKDTLHVDTAGERR